MGRHAKRKLAPEDARDAIKFGEAVDTQQVQNRLRINRPEAAALLGRAVLQGLLVREKRPNDNLANIRGALRVFFRHPDVPLEATPAPYPTVLLNAAPADEQIGRTLWSHAQLAMTVKR